MTKHETRRAVADVGVGDLVEAGIIEESQAGTVANVIATAMYEWELRLKGDLKS